MTIIVYRDGILAGDSAIWAGESIMFLHTKVHRLRRGEDLLFGWTGSAAAGQEFVDRMNEGSPWRDRRAPKDVGFLVVRHRSSPGRRHGVFLGNEDGWVDFTDAPFVAIGSACAAALGALHMGADAVTAVEVAIKVWPWVAGPVTSVSFDPPA